MGNIKLSHLEMLVSVVDAGSFSAASIELYCTQSRLSHAIAELERSLQTRLLVRSKSGCTPTDTGQRVTAKARQILRMADSIKREVQTDGGCSGHVRVASIPSVTARLIPFAVETLAQEYPRIRIEIFDGCREYKDVVQMVRDGNADVGITQAEAKEGLLTMPYIHDALVAVVPARTQISPPLRWDDLADLPLIVQTHPGGHWILDQLRLRGFKQHPAYCMEHENSIMTMIERGLGYTVLPRLAVTPEVPGLRVVDLPYVIERKLSIVTRETPGISAIGTVTKTLREHRVLTRSDAFRVGAIRIDG